MRPPLAVWQDRTEVSFILCVLPWKWSCLQCGRQGFDPWVFKIPWRKEWQATAVFLPGEFHGQSSLVGYSPRAMGSQRVRHDWAINTLFILHSYFVCTYIYIYIYTHTHIQSQSHCYILAKYVLTYWVLLPRDSVDFLPLWRSGVTNRDFFTVSHMI